MRSARKALLHAKNYLLIGEDPATLLLTLAVNNAEFLHTLEAVIVQAHEALGNPGEPEEPSIN
jgi:hypothetical protein